MTFHSAACSLVCCSFMGLQPLESDQVAGFMETVVKAEEYEVVGTQTHCGRSRSRNQSIVQTFVYMRCSESVSAYLCEKFGKAARHLIKGEMYCIRCRRCEVVPPTNESDLREEGDSEGECLTPEAVLSLLDTVGDAIVDIYDAFERFSVGSDADAKLTLSGLFQALESVGQKYCHSRERKCSDLLAAGDVHSLLRNLLRTRHISVKTIPYHDVQRPFITYTDFIAVYTNFLTELNRPRFRKVRSDVNQLYK
uniref:AlNc14C74G5011 protein n=1 Tax=Albugo laibachii Nc14 TaxID=890382 RepID=F0WEF4_9STRA|nr:AlNc14C74G5011 [Albugo laibachii Nc14]|eukprot:CCA19586.1 AlNc14C74G5011 [Albugo laibachii Nc14]